MAEHLPILEDDANCGCDDGVLLDHPAVTMPDGFIHYHLCDCPCHEDLHSEWATL
jgi:hypothetical protein